MLRNFLSHNSENDLLGQVDTLAVMRFAQGPGENTHCMHVTQLPNQDSLEAWGLDGDDREIIEQGINGRCDWRRSEKFQFTSVNVTLEPEDDYVQVAHDIYDELLTTISTSPCSQLVRFWNYLPAINSGEGDDENYKRFCDGRLAAFTKHTIPASGFPAASAVGHHQAGLTVCAISCAADLETSHHANPRQVDAFEYPRKYGPSSPSFARATTVEADDQRLCFISGTASILGHRSVHEDDLRLQLYTTNDNILYLLEETGFEASDTQMLRVYLRHGEHFEECEQIISDTYPSLNIVFAEADICRKELLVEIECFCVANRSRV